MSIIKEFKEFAVRGNAIDMAVGIIIPVLNEADVVVASRYVKGGSAKMPFFRYILSRLLNSLLNKCNPWFLAI